MQHSYCHMTPFGHSHLAVVQQHAVHLLNGTVGSVLSFKMHKGVALRPVLIAHHLFIRNGVSLQVESDYKTSLTVCFLTQLFYNKFLDLTFNVKLCRLMFVS